MSERIGWFVTFLALALVSTVLIAYAVYPGWMKTIGEALGWGLVGSGVFFGAALMFLIPLVVDRTAPLPGWLAGLGVLACIGGVIWALLWTIAVGL